MRRFMHFASRIALLSLLVPAAFADEGMWLFNKPPLDQLKLRYGFEPSREWLEHVQRACVRFPGGSGSIVSADGLVMTNHHVGADEVHKLSTPEHDYLKQGFYAGTREQELPCADLELNVLWEIEDVSARVNGAVTEGMSQAEAGAAKRKRASEIEKESTDGTGLKSEVVTLWQGGRYHLYRYKRYTDVRLVFAPDKQAAFFGGDPDNFEFPRHCLDVTFFRIYEDGMPLAAQHFLRWSTSGVSEGDLVFVAGHPGSTERLNTMAHLDYLREVRYPLGLASLWRREVQLTNFSQRNEEWRRIAEDDLFGVQNSRKAFTGRLAGLLDPSLMGKKEGDEHRLEAFVWSDPQRSSKWGDAWDQIEGAQKTSRALYERNTALNALGSELFAVARHLVRLSEEKPKASAERLREYSDAALATLELGLFSETPIYPDLEVNRLESALSRMAEWLGVRDPAVVRALAGKSPRARAEELVQGTALASIDVRRGLYDGGKEAILASKDPLIRLARDLDPESRSLRKRFEDEVDAVQRSAYAKIAEAKFALEGENVYPDATFTLRLSFGAVRGYPENGVQVEPFTTLEGLYAKSAEKGNATPYELPEGWAEAKSALDLGTPYNFTNTTDIIGGNSGSPTIDKKGEIVGIVFDGNLQSLTGNFIYDEGTNRAISVDSRGILEALGKVYEAAPLVQEITGTRP